MTNKKDIKNKEVMTNTSNLERIELKTSWDLSLLYKNDNDPKIEADMVLVEKEINEFATKYESDKNYLTDESALYESLKKYERINSDLPINAPYLYFFYKKELDSSNSDLQSKLNLIQERYTKAANKVLFFPLDLAKITPENQDKFLKSEKLAGFRYFLKSIFEQAKYNLSEKEEKLMLLKSLPASGMWVDGTLRVLNQQSIKWKNKEIPLPEAVSKVADLPKVDRYKLSALVMSKLESIADFAENEINAIVTDKKISDELRGFKKPYSSTVLNYQNEEATVENLVSTVRKYYHLSHKFYAIKAKLLGLKTLNYADRNCNLGKNTKKIEFDEAVNIVTKSFNEADSYFGNLLLFFLKKGQIDVFPKIGKTGGAYCSSGTNCPTFVLLNHIPNSNSVMTLAHEMGHAIHGDLANKNELGLYRDYSVSTAEVASTFFENFAFEELFKKLNDKEKIIALHDRINSTIAGIFRQIACFEFELELHERVRKEGYLAKKEIARLMNKHMQEYLGPKFKLDDSDGYHFVYWSHIRSFFYVYSYAFGELVSRSLYAEYKKDKNFINKVKEFLKAGSSDSPENIFKSIGCDVTKPEFFENGLKDLEREIDEFEKLVGKRS